MDDPLLWVNDPGWAHLADSAGWPVLYDITDDWTAADRPAREHARILANERLLLQIARSVVVCSSALARSRDRLRTVELIPNAVDTQRYVQPQPRPEDLGPGRTALYVGTLHEDRLDVQLCRRLGEQLDGQGASLVLLGPNALSRENTELLQRSRGVRILGSRAHDQMLKRTCGTPMRSSCRTR
ncbi:hypothetical protein [Nesterenkonia pannonica]|uniref:hypothetical protein n=1 Tax=Nesterenkonia pannonica TaxID=1548602 RepID=UPI00216489D5|nr:hypothetical protein [Nesterenkonia pannonica]